MLCDKATICLGRFLGRPRMRRPTGSLCLPAALRGCLESLERRAKMRPWDTQATSTTRNGGSSVVYFRAPSREGDPARQTLDRSSMPSSTYCAAAVLGACSPRTSPLSRRSTCTSSSGETTELGRESMTCFETASDGLMAVRRAPVQRSWTAKA